MDTATTNTSRILSKFTVATTTITYSFQVFAQICVAYATAAGHDDDEDDARVMMIIMVMRRGLRGGG